MSQSTHILVIRFSAMGDVAMTVPVLKNALEQNPQLQITVVSNAFFEPLFAPLERCSFHPAHLKTLHKGAAGIYRLCQELTRNNQSDSYRIDAVADMHNVLRSSVLKTFFKISGYKTATVDKGRKEKKELTRKENRILQPLRPMHERYADVLRLLGINVLLNKDKVIYPKQHLPPAVQSIFLQYKKTIGIAPFAQHREKMYPIEKMKTVVQLLAAENSILLFGGGAEESKTLRQWENEIKNVYAVAGRHRFAEELAIISNLDAMLSMDSANMHLASLFNVSCISIWGATHPYAGFYGWAQDEKNVISLDLDCRPCSVFGNKPCWRGDHACMEKIDASAIAQKLQTII